MAADMVPSLSRLALIGAVVALGLLAIAQVFRLDFVLYNATPSMPVGLYLRASGPIDRGSIVTVRAAAVTPGYATERNFTDPGDRFLKRVAGAAGDVVCAAGPELRVNGQRLAPRQEVDAAGRALPRWEGCVTLAVGQVFLLGDSSDSFDGRYWGPTPAAQIEGVWRKL